MIEVTCPHCGNDELIGYDRIIAFAEISGWFRNEDGKLEPHWQGSTEVLWDTQDPDDPDHPYGCKECGGLFAANELTTKEIPND